MSLEVTQLCQEHNIEFCFLPPTSINLTQPLDVAVFRPIKVKWCALLHSYKANNHTKLLKKDEFPGMLKLLPEHIGIQKNANVVRGFETCGILPLNPEAVLKKMPDYEKNILNSPSTVSAAVIEHLKHTRSGEDKQKEKGASNGKRKKLESGTRKIDFI